MKYSDVACLTVSTIHCFGLPHSAPEALRFVSYSGDVSSTKAAGH